MSSFLMVVFLLIIPMVWLRLGNLQRQVNELKTDVERLQNGTSFDGDRYTMNGSSSVNITPSLSSSSGVISPAHNEWNTELDQELLTMVRSGKKIQAIKRLREARNLSLKEAKDYVEALDR